MSLLTPDKDPIVRFGAIADVQYADVDDAPNFARTSWRRYRGALDCLRHAVASWLAGPSLDFVVDLGDIIDQQCEQQGDSRHALDVVLREWAPISQPIYRVIGNHELYNFNRAECAELIPGITPWYQAFQLAAGWRMLTLDPYDLNIIEKDAGDTVEKGIAYLSKHNPNDLRAPRGTVDLQEGLSGLERRFVPMGGRIDDEQLHWLRNQLSVAHTSSERVIILTHVPLHPDACLPGALLWNYDEVLDILEKAGRGTVAMVLAGHYHSGGYVLDQVSQIHHVTLPSPLHASPDDPRCHCTIEVWNDHIEISGCGLVPSRSLSLPSSSCL